MVAHVRAASLGPAFERFCYLYTVLREFEPCALQASNLTKALGYTRKFFQKAMTVKGTFEDFAEAVAVVGPLEGRFFARLSPALQRTIQRLL